MYDWSLLWWKNTHLHTHISMFITIYWYIFKYTHTLAHRVYRPYASKIDRLALSTRMYMHYDSRECINCCSPLMQDSSLSLVMRFSFNTENILIGHWSAEYSIQSGSENL